MLKFGNLIEVLQHKVNQIYCQSLCGEVELLTPNLCVHVFFDVILLKINYTFNSTAPTLMCENGDIQLVGGEDNFQGRVELCLGGRWGTVCRDDSWGTEEARVVCSQLGMDSEGCEF